MNIIKCNQYTAEWWDARRGIPTASEFSRIVTPKKWDFAKGSSTYAQELIAQLYDPFYGCHDEFMSTAMSNGSAMEPEARRYYEFSRGVQVEQVGFCLTDDGRFGCSPDGLVGEDGGLECKSPKPTTQIKWLLGGGVPDEHLAQCHGCMYVTGRKWWDFLSYHPSIPHLLVRVERDEKTEALGEHLDTFDKSYRAAREEIEAKQKPSLSRTVSVGGEEYEEEFVMSYF